MVAEIAVPQLSPGMTLDQDIISPDERIALGRGTVLTQPWIERIRTWGLGQVKITSTKSAQSGSPSVSDMLRSIAASSARGETSQGAILQYNRFAKEYDAIMSELQRLFAWTRCSGKVPLVELRRLSDEKIYPLLAQPGAFWFLHHPARAEEYLYRHALDVALLTGFLGQWLDYIEEAVRQMVYAGLLHDIGKARIYFELLTKPGALTVEERRLVQFHTWQSRQLVDAAGTAPEFILNTIYQHHERIDGSGYPEGLQGDEIHPFAKILAVADVYDALTSDRCYKEGVSPIVAGDIMINEMGTQFDPKTLACLFEHVRQYLQGARIKLSIGSEAQVVFFHPYPEMRPIVLPESGETLDLAANPAISIDRLLMD